MKTSAEPSSSSTPLRHDLKAMVVDGASFSVMVGAGETFVPLFVLALGLGEVMAGLVTTVPMLAGALLQLATPWAVTRIKSHRRWVVICASLQAASLLILPIAAFFHGPAALLTFAAVTIYWASGLATGPAWNTWVETIVPRRIRARFFASRTRICQLCTLLGFVLGGIILQSGVSYREPMVSFALLFVIASICRFISAGALSRQSESDWSLSAAAHASLTAEDRPGHHRGLFELAGKLRGHRGSRLIAFLLANQTAVYISAPYFAPYMREQLGLSYWQFVALTATALAARILVLAPVGKLAARIGAHRLLWIGAICIFPLSSFWIVSNSLIYLTGLQLVAGAAWAVYELAVLLICFEAIPREDRTAMLTIYNLGNAFAMVAGSLIGATLLVQFGEAPGTYFVLFAMSAVGRGTMLLLLARVPKIEFTAVSPAVRTVAVRPSAGAIESPVLPSMPGETEEKLVAG